jgi:uncharacterized coiled-coil protein SlyX
MTTGDQRDGLIARIRQVRRLAPVRDRPKGETDGSQSDPLQALETRVAHLEQLVQGLQDSVHRESERHAKLIADLQAQVEPAAMNAALADDARNRGL